MATANGRSSSNVNRRLFLETSALGLASLAWGARAQAKGAFRPGSDDLKLALKSEHPPNWETPVEAFLEKRTPNRLLFIRSHHDYPQVDLASWKLSIDGLAEKPLSFSLADLDKLPQTSVVAVLQCSGNGRALHYPPVSGTAWVRGAVGNVEWTGVKLSSLLRQAGVKPEAKHVHLLSSDRTGEETFLRSITLDRAMAESTLIGLKMNGEPLEAPHGAPARLVVPGWYGNHWIKWLHGLKLSDQPATGHAMEGYRVPPQPVPPGTQPKPEEMEIVTWMNVKSLIATPAPDAMLKSGPIVVQGIAWGGRHPATKIEAEINGEWRNAEWMDPQQPFAWRRWRIRHDAQAGALRIRCRATDASGQTQPETFPWNPRGYMWNAWDEIRCRVG